MHDVYFCTVFGFILIIIFMFFINIKPTYLERWQVFIYIM